MATPFIAEIRLFGFGIVPRNWAQCNGQLLPIAQNQALFSILGITYGGNGTSNFALPNLQGAVPVGPNPTSLPLGTAAGQESHTVILTEMPQHTHQVVASSATGGARAPAGADWAGTAAASYIATPNTTMNPACVSSAGGTQPHPNIQPYLTVNFCIALAGIFPSRN